MKRNLFIIGAMALAMMFQGCSSGGDDDNGGGGDNGGGTPEDPDKDAISIQFSNKTVSLPVLNFPAVDVSATEITIEEGNFQAKLNGTQFNGDNFAKGVLLPLDGEITIEQGGKKLVSFTPKTGGAGTKIKITGIGSTSALAAAAGIGRGIYTIKVPEGATDQNGYLMGYTVFTGGNSANQVAEIQFEGGVAYKLRRDHLVGGDAIDVEGWASAPADMGNGFDADQNQAISIYLATEASKPVGQQIPLISGTPHPSSGMIPFVVQRFVKEEGAGNNFYIQGNGDMSTFFKIGNGVRPVDYDLSSEGIPSDHPNLDPYARAFQPQTEFKLYLADNLADTTKASSVASDELCASFISDDGIDPGTKYVVFKIFNPDRVNTKEALTFIYKRKASPVNADSKIRYEGVAYDAQKKLFVIKAGLTVRSSPW